MKIYLHIFLVNLTKIIVSPTGKVILFRLTEEFCYVSVCDFYNFLVYYRDYFIQAGMSTTKNKKDQKATFAERTAAEQAKQNIWQQYNSQTKFNAKNMVKSLEDLANQTFPSDSFNSNAYQEALIKSLTETISPEVGIQDFWKAMSKAGCKTLAIIDGHLNFFGDKNAKIDITPFTQPIVFEAHSSYYKQRQMEREARITAARGQLQNLLQEIHRK